MAKKQQYKRKLEYNNEYNRNNYRSFSVRFNINTEDTVIKWLEEKEGVKEYLLGLIEADMKKTEKKTSRKTAVEEKKPAKKAEPKKAADKKSDSKKKDEKKSKKK